MRCKCACLVSQKKIMNLILFTYRNKMQTEVKDGASTNSKEGLGHSGTCTGSALADRVLSLGL